MTTSKKKKKAKREKKENVTSGHLNCLQETLLPNNVYAAVLKKKTNKKNPTNLNVGLGISMLQTWKDVRG